MYFEEKVEKNNMSPPSRRRGLKYDICKTYMYEIESPPSRRRGLKYLLAVKKEKGLRRLLRGGVD